MRGLGIDENEDTDSLLKFFSLLTHFNDGRQLSSPLKVRIETYFEHRWREDRNFALGIYNADDREMLEQLPEVV